MEKKVIPALVAAASAAEALDAAVHHLERDGKPDLPEAKIVQPAPERPPMDYVPILHHMADDIWALQALEEAQVELFDGEKPPRV